jgi:hypothetical protein
MVPGSALSRRLHGDTPPLAGITYVTIRKHMQTL